VVHYTNAATLLREDFRDTEDLDGFFSGWDAEQKKYNPESWLYEGAPVKDKNPRTPRFQATRMLAAATARIAGAKHRMQANSAKTPRFNIPAVCFRF